MTNKTTKIKKFLTEVRTEMKKVDWPTREETIKYTMVVIVATVIVALYLGVLDAILFNLLDSFVL